MWLIRADSAFTYPSCIAICFWECMYSQHLKVAAACAGAQGERSQECQLPRGLPQQGARGGGRQGGTGEGAGGREEALPGRGQEEAGRLRQAGAPPGLPSHLYLLLPCVS